MCPRRVLKSDLLTERRLEGSLKTIHCTAQCAGSGYGVAQIEGHSGPPLRGKESNLRSGSSRFAILLGTGLPFREFRQVAKREWGNLGGQRRFLVVLVEFEDEGARPPANCQGNALDEDRASPCIPVLCVRDSSDVGLGAVSPATVSACLVQKCERDTRGTLRRPPSASRSHDELPWTGAVVCRG